MLPLLGSSYFEQPSASGVVSSKTADLIAAEGDSLAKRIEAQSYSIDAQTRAKPITDLYSTAYQKIAAGDLTGFAEMQKARSLAIGNPILMKTMDDADLIAGHLANTYLQTSRQEDSQRFQLDKQEDMQKFQIDKQTKLQNSIDDRADKRSEDALTRQEYAGNVQIFKQTHSDWERENAIGQKQHQEDMKVWARRQNAAEEEAKLKGTPPVNIEKPSDFTPRPEPKVEDFTKSALPSMNLPSRSRPSNSLEPLDLPLPNDEPARSTELQNIDHTPAPGEELMPVDTPASARSRRHTSSMPLPSSQLDEGASAPAEPEPVHDQIAAKVSEGKPVKGIMFGYNNGLGMEIDIQDPGAKLEGVDIDTETGSVKKHYKLSKDEEEAKNLIGHFSSDENLSKWIAFQGRMGHQVQFKQVNIGDKKGGEKFIARTGDSEYKKRTLVNGQEAWVPEEFSKDDAEKWDKVRGLMENGVISVKHPPIPKEGQAIFRNQAIDDAVANPTSFDMGDANRQLKKLGIDPIKPDDINGRIQSIKNAAETSTKQTQDEHLKQRALSSLAQDGFQLPNKSGDGGQIANSSQRAREIPSEIDSLNKELEQMKSSSGGALQGSDLEKATQIKMRIFKLEKDLQEHRKILMRSNPVSSGASLGMLQPSAGSTIMDSLTNWK